MHIEEKLYQQIRKVMPFATCDIVVVWEGKFLLLERLGYHTGSWSVPGGHINKGETCRAAAVRELQEETGISINENKLVELGVEDFISEYKHTLTVIFLVEVSKGDVHLNSEHSRYMWVTMDKLPSPVSPFTIKELRRGYDYLKDTISS